MKRQPDNVLTRTVARNQGLGLAAGGFSLFGMVLYVAGLFPADRYAPIQFAGTFSMAIGIVCFVLAFTLTNIKLRCSRCLQRFFVGETSSEGTRVFTTRCAHCGYPPGATFEPNVSKRGERPEARTLSLRIYCPHCESIVTAEQSAGDRQGQSIKCSNCGQCFSKRNSKLTAAKQNTSVK